MSISYDIVFFAVIVGIFPITWWFWIINREKKLEKSKVDLLIKFFFWGVLSAVPASIIEMVITDTGGDNQIVLWMQKIWLFGEMPFKFTTFLFTGIIATIEEFSKLMAIVIVLGKKRLKSANEGLVAGLMIGLAFAVTENGVYFSMAMEANEIVDFSNVVMLRFVISTSAHVIYSGIAGLFFAKAKLAKRFQLVKFLLLASCLPVLLHTSFNFLLGGTNDLNSIILLIVTGVGSWLLWNEHQINHKNISPKNNREIKVNAKK